MNVGVPAGPVCVVSTGISGAAATRALRRLGVDVVVVDTRDDEDRRRAAAELRGLGAEVRLAATALPAGVRLVVAGPGLPPHAPLLATAPAGAEVIGEVELAWRLRGPDAAPWLAVTGTNGKTTAVRMLAAILTAAGRRVATVGNVGLPPVDVVGAHPPDGGPPYDVLAVELSSFQLHRAPSLRPLAGAVLNLAPDHLDWHGTFEAYAADKARIWAPGTRVVFAADDPAVAKLAAAAPGAADAVGVTLNAPAAGQLGVLDGALVDRAFAAGEPLAPVGDVRPAAPHNVANALAAAALARAYGVPAPAVAAGLRAFRPDPHRLETVAEAGGVRWVDDSKATNPHAAAAGLGAYERVVWVAGGLLKGASVAEIEELVAPHAGRLRGVVLLGRDRAAIAEALRRHAPDVPVVDVPATDHGVMDAVVAGAARLAHPGDVVLLSPAAASMDLFTDYGARGDAFAAAARRLAGGAA